MFKAFPLAMLVAATALPGAAHAHSQLVASTPAANATVAPTASIQLTFNERVMPQFSGAEVVMTGMPGMANHAPMRMTGLTAAWSSDGKTLTLTAGRNFPAGIYRVSWRAAGADMHRLEGSFTFTIR